MNKGRKITGGKYHQERKKKSFERKVQERKAIVGERKIKNLRGRGGNAKTITLRNNIVNILIEKKIQKAEIKKVIETPQNVFLARQNRLMKSAIIETSLGKAKITNRPTQEGQVNAVLIKEE